MEIVSPLVKVELRERRSINVNVGMGGEGRNVNFVGKSESDKIS